MSKTIALIGKQGPAFSDRPSGVTVEALIYDFSVISRVTNWEHDNRVDSMRAAFDQVEGIAATEQTFAGYEYVSNGRN